MIHIDIDTYRSCITIEFYRFIVYFYCRFDDEVITIVDQVILHSLTWCIMFHLYSFDEIFCIMMKLDIQLDFSIFTAASIDKIAFIHMIL